MQCVCLSRLSLRKKTGSLTAWLLLYNGIFLDFGTNSTEKKIIYFLFMCVFFTSRDLICIQSMDGMLMVFEQESYAFGRFLPGSLLPGPLAYSSRTDSFITVSSCRQVDWTLNIGEQALDICIIPFNQSASSVFVLGERNFFCLKDNGQIRFMKKLDCSPSCFLPYCSVSEGTINTLIGNHSHMLHVYQDVTLKWATQLPHVPVAVRITLQNRVVLQKVKLSVYVQPPLVLTCDQFTFDFTVPDMTSIVAFSVYLKRNYIPSELEGNAVVSYSRPTGIPRVIQCKFRLPLKLICLPGQPSKTASHKLTIDTNKSPVSLPSIFPERYRIQSEQFEDLWLITNELILRLQEYFEKQGIKDFACSFSGCVPLQEYFELIDHHFELRINGEKLEELLSERAVQFRAIQRRLLTRFRDKTPAPLQHLDTLLDGTYKQVSFILMAIKNSLLCPFWSQLWNIWVAFGMLSTFSELCKVGCEC
ncbi:Bbs9 [Phodopus roborovskii]|uniref:Bbs9 protein n=1 Tax=Phodopus roborovskii TaxID=109678 RepID=A0AAU9ZUF9_PHORO|nr:Bbs9 [Phodopus roborovskii]